MNHSDFLADYIDQHGPGVDTTFASSEDAFNSMYKLVADAQDAWNKEIPLALR